MKRGIALKHYFIQSKYINEKNISYHYTINYYKSIKALNNVATIKLSDIAIEITDGTRVKRNYVDQGVRIINVGDFKDGSIYPKSLKSIPKDGLKDKDYIKENDILIAAVGKSGQVFRITSDFEDCVISSDIIRIRLKQVSTAEGLAAYLKSKSGQYALEAIKMGTLNRININQVKKLQIPINYKDMSFNKTDLSEEIKEANKLYKECCNLFARYIVQRDNLFYFPKMIFLKPNEIEPERLDSKYYIYLKSELYKFTHSNSSNIIWQTLREIVEIKKAIRPKIDENKKVGYINISNVNDDLSIITSNERDLFKNLSSRIRYALKENEIITAKSGSATGTENHATAIITRKYKNMMASDAFYNMRPIGVDPYYILFLFKQPIILKQIEAGSTGLYFKTISRNEFEEISIPRLDPLVEEEISKKMKTYVELLQK